MNHQEYRQWLPVTPQRLFELISEPENLDGLTPDWLRWRILRRPVPLEVGSVVDYRLGWHGLPLPWSSLITVLEPPHRLEYRQLRGPYRFFRHDHILEAEGAGTSMVDIVDWSVPLEPLSRGLVEADLDRLFGERRRRLDAHFSPQPEVSPCALALSSS